MPRTSFFFAFFFTFP
ncbi:hypothetical protein [Serratia ureilytica]|nr:hypothetical protein [Serratia ureilytica]